MTKNKYLSFLIIFLITFIAPAIGSFTTGAFKEPWYSGIAQPSFNPPSWVFPPVWFTLYALMSLAVWRVWMISYKIKVIKLYFFCEKILFE